MAQMHCPNCKNYWISTPGTNHTSCATTIAFLMWPLAFAGAVMAGDGSAAYIVAGVCIVLIFYFVLARKQYEKTHHICLTCGWRWKT